MKLGMFVLVLLSILAFPTAAQSSAPYLFDVTRYTVKDGLPDSTIYSLQKDDNGFLWLGTPNGLSRFDGSSFEVFRDDPNRVMHLANRNAGNIFIDNQGQFWIGSWGDGLFIYDKNLNLIKHFSDALGGGETLGSDFIQLIIQDSDGDIWIGTNGGGLAKFDPKTQKLRRFTSADDGKGGLSHSRIWDITEGQPGEVWVATGAGLNRISKRENYAIQHFEYQHDVEYGLPHARVRKLLYEPNGDLWVGTERGLSLLKRNTNKFIPIKPANQSNNIDSAITSLTFGKNNELWIGTQRGLYLFDKTRNQFVKLVNANQLSLLSNDDVRDLMYDDTGILWVASRPSGLVKLTFPKDSFEKYSEFIDSTGRKQEVGRAQALMMDKEGHLWIGASIGLHVLRAGHQNIEAFKSELKIEPGLITSIVEQEDDTIWFGGNRGLFKLSEDKRSIQSANDIWQTDQPIVIESLFVDSRKQLWIGTSHEGLFRFDGRQIFKQNLFLNGTSLDNQNIATIAEDRNGYILVGTNGFGILRFSPYADGVQQFKADENIASLSNNQIVQLYQTSDQSIWVATSNKLNKLNEVSNTFSVFDNQQGLDHTSIKGVLDDIQQNIWVSTAFGLYRLNKAQNAFTHFTDAHGLHGNQFIPRSVAKGNNGELYFGGSTGFSKIKINGLDENMQAPKIVISEVIVDENKLPQLEFEANRMNAFNYNIRDIAFHFSDLDFLSIKRGTFSHRLLGHNAKWSQPHSSKTVTYSGLPPGNYVLEVKSQHSGVWSPDVAKFTFYIKAPWWQTWWANLTFLFGLLISIYIWNKWRLNKLTLRNENLEQEIATRTEQLVMAQRQLIESEKNSSVSSLITGIAHEINTPVGVSVTAASLLMEKSKLLIKKYQANQVTRKEFERTLDNIYTSSELVFNNLGRAADLINSFKELSVSQITQEKREINLKDYFNELFVSLKPTLTQRKIDVEINCPEELFIESYPGLIAQMITQLTINAMEHGFAGREKGQIRINAQQVNKTVHIHFADNGNGIPAHVKDRIFEPFFTTKRGNGGTGLGLQVVANIVTISLGGKITFSTDEQHGTVFNIEFANEPIKR